MSNLIKPLEITAKDIDGNEHKYTISRLPATVAINTVGKLSGGIRFKNPSDAQAAQEVGDILMAHVAVEINGELIRLSTGALVDNHVPDGEALGSLVVEMVRHNTSFFGIAGSRDFLPQLLAKLEIFAPKVMQMLTPLLQQLLGKSSQP